MISIQGLTAKQKTIMDILWTMDTMTQVEAFIKSLPRDDAIDAHGMIAIAVVDTIEEEQGLGLYEDIARSTIDHARRL